MHLAANAATATTIRRKHKSDYDKRGEGVEKFSSRSATGSRAIDLMAPVEAVSGGRAESARTWRTGATRNGGATVRLRPAASPFLP
jgi:hypothetical protein